MADNVAITAGSGTTIATDDIGGVHYQIEKSAWGPADTANLTDTASGKPLPVQLRSSTGLIPLGEPTDAKSTATDTTSVSVVSILKEISAMAQAPAALPANQSSNVAQINGVTPLMGNGATGTGALRVSIANDSTGIVNSYGFATTVSTSVTKSTTTTTYTANDNWSDSTTAPTAGGYTFTSAARASGGSGIITDAIISCSVDPALLLQGEVWITDTAFATNDNDNAAFTCSDADALTLVAVIPFTLASTVAGSGTTSWAHIQNLNIGFTTVGSANLRFKVKVKNAYVNTASEVLNVRLKIVQTN